MLSSEDLLSKVTLTGGEGKGGSLSQSYGLLLLMLPPLNHHGDAISVPIDKSYGRCIHFHYPDEYVCIITVEKTQKIAFALIVD